MRTKCVGLALVAALVFGQSGQAQTSTAAQSSATAAAGANGSGRTAAKAGDSAVAAVTVGWYVVHATNCSMYYDGTYNWLFVYPSEGGYWYTATLATQTVLAPACQTGNWVAFYVDNTSGHWNTVITYNYK